MGRSEPRVQSLGFADSVASSYVRSFLLLQVLASNLLEAGLHLLMAEARDLR